MSQMFTSDDLSLALKEMKAEGAALVPGLLSPGFLVRVHCEVAAGPFREVGPAGGVGQHFGQYAFGNHTDGFPLLEELRAGTRLAVSRGGAVIGDSGIHWIIYNDTMVQRYRPGDHLDAHRDNRRFRYVIAIWSLSGICRFELLGEGSEAHRVFRPSAGDLILLRGDEGHGPDRRPLHRLVVLGERISATFRYNSLLKGVPGVNYLNGAPEEELWI